MNGLTIALQKKLTIAELHSFHYSAPFRFQRFNSRRLIGPQLLVFADDANLLGDNTDATKKNTETSTDASKGLGLEINVEKIKYVSLSSPECRAKL
jgi:hypothetical protein